MASITTHGGGGPGLAAVLLHGFTDPEGTGVSAAFRAMHGDRVSARVEWAARGSHANGAILLGTLPADMPDPGAGLSLSSRAGAPEQVVASAFGEASMDDAAVRRS